MDVVDACRTRTSISTHVSFRGRNIFVSSGPARFNSRTQVTGYSHVFTKRGMYALYCTIHQKMRMTVVVR